jgi:hypothetical protein
LLIHNKTLKITSVRSIGKITNCLLKLDTTMKLSSLLFAGFLFTTSAGDGDGRLALKNRQGNSKSAEGKAKTDSAIELREAVTAWITHPTAAAIK